MANQSHLRLLLKGVREWNSWRLSDPKVIPDLIEVALSGANLSRANLTRASLSRANLSAANLSGANLTRAKVDLPVLVNRKTRVTAATIPKRIAGHFSDAVGISKATITDEPSPTKSAVSTTTTRATGPDNPAALASQLDQIAGRLTHLEQRPTIPDLSDKITRLEQRLASTASAVENLDKIENSANAANAKLREIESELRSVKDISKLAGEYESLAMEVATLPDAIAEARGEFASWKESAQSEVDSLKQQNSADLKDLTDRYASLPEEVAALPDELTKARQQLAADQEKAKTELGEIREAEINRLNQKFETWEEEVKKTKESVQAAIALADSNLKWDDISSSLQRQAYWWVVAAVGGSIVLLAGAAWLLSQHDGLLAKAIDANTWQAYLRPAILVAIPSSVLIYLIRTFVRLALSAFHLRRDADERRMVSNLYIGLIKDASVGEEARGIVLQALFTRSDTGLLQKDSAGATMPGQLAAMAFGRAKGK